MQAGQQPLQRRLGVDEIGTAADHLGHDLGERQVGQRRLGGVEAVTDEHRGAARGQLADQPRLPHPGLAGEQDPGRPARGGLLERAVQRRQLRAAAHQLDVRPQPHHAGHRGTGPRQFRVSRHRRQLEPIRPGSRAGGSGRPRHPVLRGGPGRGPVTPAPPPGLPGLPGLPTEPEGRGLVEQLAAVVGGQDREVGNGGEHGSSIGLRDTRRHPVFTSSTGPPAADAG